MEWLKTDKHLTDKGEEKRGTAKGIQEIEQGRHKNNKSV